MLDVTLLPSGVSEQVLVTATLARARIRHRVGKLADRSPARSRPTPTPGRNPFFLAVTTPNVVPSGDPQFVRQQDQTNASLLSLAGGPRRGNNYTLEGVAHHRHPESRGDHAVDRSARGSESRRSAPSTRKWAAPAAACSTPSAAPDRTCCTAARSCRTGRSGAMGELFFAKQQKLPKPDGLLLAVRRLRRAGPIVQNRTFFFASTEGYNTLTSRNTVLTLPTALERQRRLLAVGHHHLRPADDARPIPIIPASSSAIRFPNNTIPAERLNPVARSRRCSICRCPRSGKTIAGAGAD